MNLLYYFNNMNVQMLLTLVDYSYLEQDIAISMES